jgi:hypothetical protein
VVVPVVVTPPVNCAADAIPEQTPCLIVGLYVRLAGFEVRVLFVAL